MSASDRLIDRYLDWLREHCTERDVGEGWTALTFRFLDRHNDHLEVFVRPGPDGIEITDDGAAVRDLAHRSHDPSAAIERAQDILRGFGHKLHLHRDDEIRTIAHDEDFAPKLHAVLNAMLAIDGLGR